MLEGMQFPEPSTAVAAVSVMIVEDQTAIRELLAHYLSACPGFTVVAEASTADEALRLAELHRPRVVVLDWVLPNGTGLKFLREGLRGLQPPRVLVFSGNTTDLAVREALSNGAKGYLEKTAKFAEFTEALGAVAEGRVYLSPEIARAVHRMACHPESSDFRTTLTERELMVLRCLAEGMTSKVIAAKLAISVRTVGNHRLRIAQKTGLSSIAQMTLHAARLGLLSEV
jgi:DNA-binding NarL/FixJ family response regulator